MPGAHTDGALGTTLHTAAAQADETRLFNWQLTHDGRCVVGASVTQSVIQLFITNVCHDSALECVC